MAGLSTEKPARKAWNAAKSHWRHKGARLVERHLDARGVGPGLAGCQLEISAMPS